jgi:hypothetical protein
LDPKIFDAEIPGYRDIRRARARRIDAADLVPAEPAAARR